MWTAVAGTAVWPLSRSSTERSPSSTAWMLHSVCASKDKPSCENPDLSFCCCKNFSNHFTAGLRKLPHFPVINKDSNLIEKPESWQQLYYSQLSVEKFISLPSFIIMVPRSEHINHHHHNAGGSPTKTCKHRGRPSIIIFVIFNIRILTENNLCWEFSPNDFLYFFI